MSKWVIVGNKKYEVIDLQNRLRFLNCKVRAIYLALKKHHSEFDPFIGDTFSGVGILKRIDKNSVWVQFMRGEVLFSTGTDDYYNLVCIELPIEKLLKTLKEGENV